MASYNRVIMAGNLTRDPQLSYTAANTAICKFGLATTHKWRDKEGNQREDVCFVDCTVFGRAGETFNQYMKKGRPVLIEGRLQFDQWTTPEGDKRSKHVILVDNFTFLGGAQGGQGGEGRSGQGGGYSGQRGEAPVGAPAGSRAPVEDYDPGPPPDDEPPF